MCRPIRSRCATSRAPAIPSRRCSRSCLPRGRTGRPRCGWRMRRRPSRSARKAPPSSRRRNCGAKSCRMLLWRPKKRSSRRRTGLDAHLEGWRKQDLRIGFTNGCFDILHPGHVKVLTAARGACDRLIVGLNSDASVKRLKGEGSPGAERARARRSAGGAGGGRSRRGVRRRHADQVDHADQAERTGKGWRLYPRSRSSAMRSSKPAAAKCCWLTVLPGFSTTSLVDRAREGKA